MALLVSQLRKVDFPTPWQPVLRLGDMIAGAAVSGHPIYRHVADSLARWAMGFALASTGGIAYGLLAAWHVNFERATMPEACHWTG